MMMMIMIYMTAEILNHRKFSEELLPSCFAYGSIFQLSCIYHHHYNPGL